MQESKRIATINIAPMLSPLPWDLVTTYYLKDMNNAELWRNRRVCKGWYKTISQWITQETYKDSTDPKSRPSIYNLGARIMYHLAGLTNPADLSLIGRFDFHFRFFMNDELDNPFLAPTAGPVFNIVLPGGSHATWAEWKLDFWYNCMLAKNPPKLCSQARCKMVTNLDYVQVHTTGQANLSPMVSFKTQRKDYETGVTATYEAAACPLLEFKNGGRLIGSRPMQKQIWEDRAFWNSAKLEIDPLKAFSSERTRVYIDIHVNMSADIPNSVVFYEDDLQTGYGYETRFIYSNFYKVEQEILYDWIAHQGNGLKDNYRKAIMEEDLAVWSQSINLFDLVTGTYRIQETLLDLSSHTLLCWFQTTLIGKYSKAYRFYTTGNYRTRLIL